MAIPDWPDAERPRERLLAHGPAALSDAELLAVTLHVGSRGQSAVDLGRACLDRFGGLAALFGAPWEDVRTVPGLGAAKYARLQAVLELARRAVRTELADVPVFETPGAVRQYLQLGLRALPSEVFVALFLDARHRLISADEMFRGTLTQTAVYPREIVKRALARNAAAVIFAHNHPSGVAQPSAADRALTDTLAQALSVVDIRVLDHVIVAGARTWSFAEHGLL